jgi:hypothetical protein
MTKIVNSSNALPPDASFEEHHAESGSLFPEKCTKVYLTRPPHIKQPVGSKIGPSPVLRFEKAVARYRSVGFGRPERSNLRWLESFCLREDL